MLFAGLLGLVAPAAWTAQDAPTPVVGPVAPTMPSLDELQAEFARLQQALDTAPDDAKPGLTADIEAAHTALEQGKTAEAERAEFDRQAREAPALIESIRTELATPPAEVSTGLSDSATVPEVEQAQVQANAELAAAKAEVQSLETEKGKRSTRLTKGIPDEITAAKQRRRAVLDGLTSMAQIAEPSLTDQARRLRLQCELYAADRQIARLEAEQQSYLAREQLLPSRKDRSQRRVDQADKLIGALQTAMADARRRQASKAAEEAARLKEEAQRVAQSSPTLKAIADENVELTEELTGPESINRKLERITRRTGEVTKEIQGIRARFKRVHESVEKTGLTDAIGVVLRRELDALKSASRIRAASLAKPSDVSNAQLRMVDLEERVDQLKDTGTLLAKVQAELPEDRPEAFRKEVEQIARDIIEQRAANLTALTSAYTTYVDEMAALQGGEHELIDVSDAYRNYIEERILWVRSVVQGRRVIDPSEALEAMRWLFLSPGWLQVPRLLWHDVLTRPFGYLGLLSLVVASIPLHVRARRGLRRSAEAVATFRTDHFSATVRGAIWTALIALPFPLLIFAAGVALHLPTDQVPVALAAAAGLERVGSAYLLVEILRHLIRPGGLGDAHFRWRKPGQKLIRSNLVWFVPLMLPGLFLMTAMRQQETSQYFETLGRLSFIYLMIALAVFAGRVLSPRAPLIRPMLRDGGWMERLRFVWYPAVPGLPLLFALLSMLGYFYSAYQLAVRLRYSFWFILAVIVMHAILLRWLFIARRRLAVEQARKARMAAMEAARKQDDEAKGSSVDIAVDEPEVNIPSLDQQTRRFFRMGIAATLAFGLFGIWSSVLPALNMLERVQLWPRIAIVELPAGSIDPILVEDAGPSAAPAVSSDSTSPATPGSANGATGGATNGSAGGSTTEPAASTAMQGPLSGLASSSSSSSSSSEEPQLGLKTQSITLADVGLALIIAVITLLAGRNLPGLLEIAFLQRLPLDTGSRFAIATVARYTIFILGFTAALGAVEIGWSKVQWLAAALTFGLAFGLQEIFANFVSGLIILAERPVRVGDTVTVGSVSGTVTRIQMRATTITDWDRKELIVPNKSFITDQVINWSLSSTILRVMVEVGIAYGSDVKKAEQLLYEAAEECDLIIDDPPARVWFLGFGDNSLNFRLNAFISTIDHLLASRSAIHFLINQKFADAGISISFPQRDVHLDTARPLDIRIVDAQGRSMGGAEAAPETPPVR